MKSNHSELAVGVIGVGHMGRHHVRIVSETKGVTLAGLHDTDPARAHRFCTEYGCDAFDTLDGLLDRADAVTVAAPTSEHLSIGERCLRSGTHVMMEKPLADSLERAMYLVDAAGEAGVILMVGHVERYNPAIRKMMELIKGAEEEIVSIDTRRLAPFDGSRCLDVDVLYDLLIHDVDLVLEIADSPIRSVSAVGRPVFSQRTDSVHALIEFENQACAVLWAGKCSPRKMRAITVTTRSRCYEADTLANTLTVHTAEELPAMDEGLCFMGEITAREVPVPTEEPLRAELEDFFAAVKERRSPLVDGHRAVRDLEALQMVVNAFDKPRETL
jgi:predicted dehydrogenase